MDIGITMFATGYAMRRYPRHRYSEGERGAV